MWWFYEWVLEWLAIFRYRWRECWRDEGGRCLLLWDGYEWEGGNLLAVWTLINMLPREVVGVLQVEEFGWVPVAVRSREGVTFRQFLSEVERAVQEGMRRVEVEEWILKGPAAGDRELAWCLSVLADQLDDDATKEMMDRMAELLSPALAAPTTTATATG